MNNQDEFKWVRLTVNNEGLKLQALILVGIYKPAFPAHCTEAYFLDMYKSRAIERLSLNLKFGSIDAEVLDELPEEYTNI